MFQLPLFRYEQSHQGVRSEKTGAGKPVILAGFFIFSVFSAFQNQKKAKKKRCRLKTSGIPAFAIERKSLVT
jgi:hypothetical protein